MATETCSRCGKSVVGGICSYCLVESALGADEEEMLRFGEYEDLEEIGRGGMGVVYKARQRGLGRVVAIKTLRMGPLAAGDELARFQSEAQILARLKHPNIVSVHEIGEESGQAYFSMDFVPGRTLAEILRAGPLAPQVATRYARIIAGAVATAHAQGILHRDLKPGNVLINDDDEPVVTDFGIARLEGVSPEVTVTGQIMGSPSYMAPEQASGRRGEITERTDVYSLGALLYACLCGRPPFQADTAIETVRQLIETEPAAPRLLNPGIPRDLQTICLKCLEKDPARRYPNAHALAEDLDRFARHEPILARPVAMFERGWRWCRRRPALAAALGLVMVGFLAALLQWRRAELGEARAQKNLARVLMDQGWKDAAGGDYFKAVSAFAQADDGSASHRERIGHLLAQLPRPNRLWAVGGQISATAFDSRRELIATGGEKMRVFRKSGDELFAADVPGVTTLEFSPDGKLLAGATRSGVLYVWSLTESRPAWGPVTNPWPVMSISFSPTSELVAAGGHPQGRSEMSAGFAVWNAATGQEIYRLDEGAHTARLLKFMPDGERLLVGCNNALSAFVEARTGRVVSPAPKEFGYSYHTRGAALDRSGSLLLLCGWIGQVTFHGGVKILNAATGEGISDVLGFDGKFNDGVFSPDGRRIAAIEDDFGLRVWTWRTGEQVFEPIRHQGQITRVAYSKDGAWLMTASMDGTTRLWDAETGAPVTPSFVNAGPALDAFLDEDNFELTAVCANGVVTTWDLRPALHPARKWFVKEPVLRMAASPAGDLFVVGSENREGFLVRPGEAKAIPIAGPFEFPAFYKDSRFTIGLGDRLSILDTKTGERRVAAGELHPADKSGLRMVGLAGGGKTAWSVTDMGRVGSMELESGKVNQWFDLQSPQSPHFRVLLHDNEDQLIAGYNDGNAQFIDLRTGNRAKTFRAHSGVFLGIEPSPDGKLFATSSEDQTARVWRMSDAEAATPPLPHQGVVFKARFSPDSKRVATASGDRTARVWDAQTGAPLIAPIVHAERVLDAMFDRSGAAIATVSADQVVRLWDSATGEPLSAPMRHGSEVVGIAFADDDGLVTLARDGTFRIWPRFRKALPESAIENLRLLVDRERTAVISGAQYVDLWRRVAPELPKPAIDLDALRKDVAREKTLRLILIAEELKVKRRWSEALPLIDALLAEFPENWSLWRDRASVLYHWGIDAEKRGKTAGGEAPFEAAQATYRRALESVPKDRRFLREDIWAELANIYARLGRWNDWIETLEKAAEDLEFRWREIDCVQHRLLGRAEVRDPLAAKEFVERMLKKRPAALSLYVELGHCELRLGSPEKALECLNKAKTLGLDGRCVKAIALWKLGREADSQAVFAEAEKIYRTFLLKPNELQEKLFKETAELVSLKSHQK